MKKKTQRRVNRLISILIYAILTAGLIHGFRMLTILWTTAVYQEAFQLCPTSMDYQTTLSKDDIEKVMLGELQDLLSQ